MRREKLSARMRASTSREWTAFRAPECAQIDAVLSSSSRPLPTASLPLPLNVLAQRMLQEYLCKAYNFGTS